MDYSLTKEVALIQALFQWVSGSVRQAARLAVLSAAHAPGPARHQREPPGRRARLRRRAARLPRGAGPAAARRCGCAQWHPGTDAHRCYWRLVIDSLIPRMQVILVWG